MKHDLWTCLHNIWINLPIYILMLYCAINLLDIKASMLICLFLFNFCSLMEVFFFWRTMLMTFLRMRAKWSISSSVQFSLSFMFNSFVSIATPHHELQHARLPCPAPTPRACANSCPSSRPYHPTVSSSVVPFSSHLQYFSASGFFPMSPFFSSGGQNIGVSALAPVLPMNIQDFFF